MPPSALHSASLVALCFLLHGSWSSHGFTLGTHLHLPQRHHQQLMFQHDHSRIGSDGRSVGMSRSFPGLSCFSPGVGVGGSSLIRSRSVHAPSRDPKLRLDHSTPSMSCLGAEQNVISGVLGELGNIRTPAALLGGAALGTMFVPLKPDGNKRLHLLYTILSTSAFSLQLVCVLCSTLSYTSAASRTEAMAVSAISYLSDQMQWEFFVIRGSFVYGLFSFLGSLAVRGWLTFSASEDRGCARAMTVILASSGLFLLNYLHYTHNSLTLCLGGMTKALIPLTLRNMYPTRKRFFRHLFAVAAVWVAVKVLKLGPNEG